MAEGSPSDYEVGYGKPPAATRFQPGKSGNPRGRPRGAKGLKAELKAELDEFVTITVDGKQQRLRKRRLVIEHAAMVGGADAPSPAPGENEA